MIATTKRNLVIGETIYGLSGYMSYGQCERADVTANARLLPMGVAEGCVLRHAVAKDQDEGGFDDNTAGMQQHDAEATAHGERLHRHHAARLQPIERQVVHGNGSCGHHHHHRQSVAVLGVSLRRLIN